MRPKSGITRWRGPPGPVRSWDDAAGADGERFAAYFHALFERGIAIAPSGFEAGFLSTAHTEDDVDRFVDAARTAPAVAFGKEGP